MVVAILLIGAFVATVAMLITLGLRQRLTLDLPPPAWPEPIELAETAHESTHRLRVIRWMLLPIWLAAALIGQWLTWLRWLVILLGAAYVGLVVATVVVDLRFAIKALKARKSGQ